jgi:hypothetical protein
MGLVAALVEIRQSRILAATGLLFGPAVHAQVYSARAAGVRDYLG